MTGLVVLLIDAAAWAMHSVRASSDLTRAFFQGSPHRVLDCSKAVGVVGKVPAGGVGHCGSRSGKQMEGHESSTLRNTEHTTFGLQPWWHQPGHAGCDCP